MKISKWVGNIGEKQDFSLTIEKTESLTGPYGSYMIVSMTDEDGNIVVWNTTKNLPDYMGVESKFKATAIVKKHSTHKDIQKTNIVDVKVIQENKEAEAC